MRALAEQALGASVDKGLLRKLSRRELVTLLRAQLEMPFGDVEPSAELQWLEEWSSEATLDEAQRQLELAKAESRAVAALLGVDERGLSLRPKPMPVEAEQTQDTWTEAERHCRRALQPAETGGTVAASASKDLQEQQKILLQLKAETGGTTTASGRSPARATSPSSTASSSSRASLAPQEQNAVLQRALHHERLCRRANCAVLDRLLRQL